MLTVLTVEEAQQRIINSLNGKLTEIENISLLDALGCVTAKEIVAAEPIPSFARSTMDGFAVRSSDTFGASESIPVLLTLKGNILMGKKPPGNLEPGETMSIPTGGMLPPGSDSVVMVEFSEILGDQVAIYSPAAPLANMIRIGEDFEQGSMVLPAGQAIRYQDVGVLSALACLELEVYSRPKVVILSTGDEIISPKEQPKPGQIRDINGLALSAQVLKNGGIPQYQGIVADEKTKLRENLLALLDNFDVVIVSGGSSVGTRDITAEVIDEVPGGGVLFHGVSMSPGKPVIYGTGGGKPIFGLSGNPVSAMFSFMLFVKPALRMLQGLAPFPEFSSYIEARLKTNLSSPGGREDYIRVALTKEQSPGGETIFWARPVFGGSSLLSTMVKGDGYFVIPRDVEGFSEGDKVRVFLF